MTDHSPTRSAPASLSRRTREMDHLLRDGELALDGRLVDSSNNALVGSVHLGDRSVRCVYKPIRGERPLWDFPEGTLAGREVAAYEISEAAGWGCVPTTVMREGPFGPGMVQRWVDDADPDDAVGFVPHDDIRPGWLPVLAAEDEHGRPFVLAHADTPELATLAAFDLVVNNADRKGCHVLPGSDGHVQGVDHGVTFHHEAKLRTVLWGWAGQSLPGAATAGLARLAASLGVCPTAPSTPRGASGGARSPDAGHHCTSTTVSARAADLPERLSELISRREVAALGTRILELLAQPSYPLPPTDRTPIPWPPL